jgi:uncharacterized membrane protein YdjX (TVP38/TMEM64 family)
VLARRIAAASFVVLLVACAIVARRAGVDGPMVQRELLALGWLAAPLFLLVMAGGELLHLPGMIFVVVARQLVAAARATTEPWRPRWPFVRRALARLETHPVQTIALLRLVLWLAAPLSYALASSTVKVRDVVIGSALGLFAPVLVAVVLTGYF